MRRYQINQTAAGRHGFVEEGPPPTEDHKWHGVREFWSKSFAGKHTVDYDEGVAMALEDREEENTANRDALNAIEKSLRDTAWQASRDGYEDTVKKRLFD